MSERDYDEMGPSVWDLQKQIDELRGRLDRALHQWPIPHLPTQPYMPQAQPGCHVCGIPGNVAMGYVCNNPNCPTRVSCG